MDRTVGNIVRRSMSLTQLRTTSKDLSAAKIRSSFLDYFCENNKHLHIRSCPVFSLRDPTLAFVNAGMNQFKDIFLGLKNPPSPRVANSQKCIRVGGKHNDLDLVGEDGYHHTFFEMLGNWSFGDYFKKEACSMAWEMLVKVYQIQPERLYVTYFGGDKSLGLGPDLEVKEIWRDIGVQENHILPFGVKENFWEGGPTGPCGPCTEIHYDHCPGRTDAGERVNTGSNDLTELWNLVFTQYNRKPNGKLEKLNRHFVDTGMGFERLVAVLQEKNSNYDTDLFVPLFEAIKKYTRHEGYGGQYNGNSIDCAYRILADHARMISVALSDGVLPSASGKLKRTIRKAFLISEKIFRADAGLLKELTNHVAESLSEPYPEIGRNLNKIHYIIENEENILRTQRKFGSNQWDKITKTFPSLKSMNVVESPQLVEGFDYVKKNILDKGKLFISGEDTWILLDTLGIPVHVSEQLAMNLGLKFDVNDFEKYEFSLKTSAREALHSKYEENKNDRSYLNVLTQLEKMKIEPSLDYFKHDYRIDSEGRYIFKKQSTTIQAVIFKDKVLKKISGYDIQDEEVGLVLDRTQLFNEEGGQASDHGTLTIENETVFDIKNVVNVKGYAIHFGTFKQLPSGSEVGAGKSGVIEVDEERRLKIMKNHTSLHLLNAALRDSFIGCSEKFSEVTPEKLLLTVIMYKKKIDKITDVKALEKYVCDFILHGVFVKRRVLDHSEFQKLHDVTFVPGDFILDAEIPVVEINSGFKLSKEYCKGAHVLNTSEIKDFVITKHSQGKHSAHTFEALTGDEASRIRQIDSRALEKWSHLEKDIFISNSLNLTQVDDLISKVKNFQLDLDKAELSLAVRYTFANKIEEAKRKLKILKKELIRCVLGKELQKALDTVEKFVVHCVDLNSEFSAELEAVVEKPLRKPLMLLAKVNDLVTVHCLVPEEYVSDNFNAKNWLQSSVTFGGVGTFKKAQNPNLIYHLKERKFNEEQLSNIIKMATDYAKKNTARQVVTS